MRAASMPQSQGLAQSAPKSRLHTHSDLANVTGVARGRFRLIPVNRSNNKSESDINSINSSSRRKTEPIYNPSTSCSLKKSISQSTPPIIRSLSEPSPASETETHHKHLHTTFLDEVALHRNISNESCVKEGGLHDNSPSSSSLGSVDSTYSIISDFEYEQRERAKRSSNRFKELDSLLTELSSLQDNHVMHMRASLKAVEENAVDAQESLRRVIHIQAVSGKFGQDQLLMAVVRKLDEAHDLRSENVYLRDYLNYHPYTSTTG